MDTPVLLVAEDDLDDQTLIQDALARLPFRVDLHFVQDGKGLLHYLHAGSEGRPKPHLVLLDLNMPGMNGQRVLEEMQSRPAWSNIPVVVLTTSNAEEDIQNCRRLGAKECYQKPSSLAALSQILGTVISRFV